MTYSPISFQAIDFSKPDCEFVYKGEIYQIKQYLNKCFFKDKNHQGYDFIYSFEESYLAENICEKDSLAEIEELLLENAGYIERCVEYEQTIFCFSINQESQSKWRGGQMISFEQISGNGVHFSHQYEGWVFVSWQPPKYLNLDEFLELPHEFFLQQAIAACDRGLLAAFSLQAIDFSQPNGEFSYQGQIYQVKQYLGKDFFKHNLAKNDEFIYSFEHLFPDLEEKIYQPQHIKKATVQIDLEKEVNTQRCIEYAGTIFCLGYKGEYCSFKSRYWIPIYWRHDRNLLLNDILQQSKEFWIKQAHTASLPCSLKIDDQEIHPALRAAYKFRGAEPLTFVRGSETELKRLTQIAAYTLPELQPLFERYSSLKVHYTPDNDLDDVGFQAIYMGEVEDWTDQLNKEKFSRQARRLFQLVYEHNRFTGNRLTLRYGGPGFSGYERWPLTITVEVQAPSQHEKLEAALELQSWLSDKLPEAEINAYLEGNYELDLPEPIDEQQLDDIDDVPF